MHKLSALLVWLCACGSVGNAIPDAGSAQPPPGPVTIKVYVDGDAPGAVAGQLDLGATVVFVDSSGQLIKDTLVDSSGNATADVPANSTVHVLRVTDDDQTNRRVHITSIVGISPGDKLQAGRSKLLTDFAGSTSTMKATFPAATGASVSVATPCQRADVATGATNLDLTLQTDCAASSFDILQTIDTGVNNKVDYRFKKDVALLANSTVALDQPAKAMTNFQLTITNTPASVKGISMTRSTLIGSQPSIPLSSIGSTAPVAGANQLVAPHPAGIGKGSATKLDVEYAAGTEAIEQLTTSTEPSGGIDMDKLRVPVIASKLAFIPTGLNITFTVDSGRTADVAYYRWQGGWQSGIRSQVVIWDVYSGVPTQTFVLPTLPSKFSQYDPSTMPANSVTVTNGIAFFVDTDAIAGWDEARQLGDTMLQDLWTLPKFVNRTVTRRLSAQFEGR